MCIPKWLWRCKAGDLLMKKRKVIVGIICVFALILLDFIPIKFALKNNENKTVFINEPKLGNVEWAEIEYEDSKFNYNSMIGYIVEGKAPDRVLNKKDFDKINLYLMHGDNINRFLIYYDERKPINDSETFSVYKIVANDWEILYPIQRASLRRLYASKKYLTLYDFNLINLIKEIFGDG